MSDSVRVLVTGFGAFQDIIINPSFEIVKRLPQSLPGIELIAHQEPLKAAYRSLLQVSPQLIGEHNPDIVVHVGLAMERDYFAVEQSACRDGYHQYPDVDRQVIPKSEGQKIWGKKSAERLDTSLDLEQVVQSWKQNLRIVLQGCANKKGKTHQQLSDVGTTDLRLSDDVGNYVCGLVYYTSLAEMVKSGNDKRNVVFLHVPPLSGEPDFERGKVVLESLIRALVDAFQY